ncbi:MAG: AmpG family muropeptide MFS transporter [Tolumonas sp.]|nr:AmpG family muropeptide MFS transporter [Tolumonas sp.]
MPQTHWYQQLFTRRMLICVFTGFSSGLPLYLLLNLVPAWLKTEQIDLKAIGLLSLVQFPYTWKFIWSPLIDRYPIFNLGRRRGWMLLSQLALIIAIASLGFFSPQTSLWTIAYLAFGVAFFSASQDIVLDAYRREILSDHELGLGNSVHVNAYRIAGLVPGSLSLILADHLPWHWVFPITALFMLPGLMLTLMCKEPASSLVPRTLREAVIEPFHEFLQRQGVQNALLILAFIFLYKLGDSMATSLATPFYQDIGFSKTEIGLIAKHAGLWPSVIGGMLGGIWMLQLGINRALWLFGIVQILAIFGFYWLAGVGHDRVALGFAIGFEAFGVGIGTAAFIAFIARTTDPRYTATQFALFTSLAAVPRTFFNASTGWLVELMGWQHFFLLCALLALPGMLLLFKVAPWQSEKAE